MLHGHRIVVCIPYGRRRTVGILMNYLRRDRAIIDEVQFWMNTEGTNATPDRAEDVAWAHEQEKIYGGWVRCIPRPNSIAGHPKQSNTGFFYALAQDEGTFYFRMDDDLVYVHPRYFEEMVSFRLANPDYLFIMGNIINNAVVSWIHQQAGRIGTDHGIVESPWCMDPVGWTSIEFAVKLHEQFLDSLHDDTVDRWLFDEPWPLLDGRQFSISTFLWTGDQARAWGGATRYWEEETFLTMHWPKEIGKVNVINGRALVSHYSFFTQQGALDQTDILARYKTFSEDQLSRSYYALLGADR